MNASPSLGAMLSAFDSPNKEDRPAAHNLTAKRAIGETVSHILGKDESRVQLSDVSIIFSTLHVLFHVYKGEMAKCNA